MADFHRGNNRLLFVLVALNGKNHFRLVGISEKKSYLKLNEVFVFSDGDCLDWVQQWEPTPKKADLLLLVAHPDDELIFFGGTIPTYAVEKNMNVVVAYMSYSNTTRRSELLNGLWHMGLRQYPGDRRFRRQFICDRWMCLRSLDKKKKPCIYHGTHSPIQAGCYDYA